MDKKNYLNLGCGKRFHPSWTNIDLVSFAPKYVKEANILKGIPHPDNSFDVVYHSHLFEHLPRAQALHFIKECFRVLKPGGIIRVVVPDLEQSTRLYLQFLEQNLENPTPESIANYQWMVLEMYDQAVREQPGGDMLKYLSQNPLLNEDFVRSRLGIIVTDIRDKLKNPVRLTFGQKLKKFWQLTPKLKYRMLMDRFILLFLFGQAKKIYKAGMQRLSGEMHYWMYDQFSLGLLFQEVGLTNVSKQTATSSYISDWNEYELDTRKSDGFVFKPDSLFMEAKKPA